MASEQIGNLYPTVIPGYDDAADIQAALRMYHYGSDSYDINNSNSNPVYLPASSIAGNLAALESDILSLQNTTISGIVSSAEPTTNLKDGYVWLDSDGTNASGPYSATSIYQPTAPVTGLANGLIWIKKGVNPLELYVYNSTSSAWDQVI